MPRHEHSGDQQHGSRHRTKPYEQKQRHGNSNKTNKYSEKLPTSVSTCKRQIRDINRLLAKDAGLPSTKRVEFERRVKALEIQKEKLNDVRSTKANASRYHGIKFFERKKVLRKLAQAEKKQKSEESSETDELIQDLLVNLNYTTYYPDEVKYISLYPADPSKTPPEVLEKQSMIRSAIRVAIDNSTLPTDPRLVQAKDRKAIRKNNRTLLRTVSLAHGHEDIGSDSDQKDNDDDDDEDDFFE
ncbi:18S rRNA maturation protein [Coemansia sp. RSA 1933]|nr:18S rRNA maturation protein [Coemansia sp. RSA 1933]